MLYLNVVWVSDHVGNGLELDERSLPRALVHPLSVLQPLLEGALHVVDHVLRDGLGAAVERLLDEQRPQREAEHGVGVRYAQPPPAGLCSLFASVEHSVVIEEFAVPLMVTLLAEDGLLQLFAGVPIFLGQRVPHALD